MKKQFLLFVAATLISLSSLMAQDAARARQTPEERTKATMEKLAKFDLVADTRTKVEAVFTDFYRSQQEAMQAMRASGTSDRTVMMEKRKQLTIERDTKLKALFTEEQYAKWTSEIEPSLRPQRPATAPAN